MTVQPPGTVPNYIDPTTLNTGGIAPASGGTSPGVYGDQIDLNFEHQRWSKGARILQSPTDHDSGFTVATNPVTWTTITAHGDRSDTDGYFDPAFPDRLVVPSGRAGMYLLHVTCQIGDTVINGGNPALITGDSYELRAWINSTTVVRLGQFIQGQGTWPTGGGYGLAPLVAADVIQFQVTSATSRPSEPAPTKFMQGTGEFGMRFLGTS